MNGLGTGLGGSSKFTGFKSGCRAYRDVSNQTIAHNTLTKAQLNAETYDGLLEFDPVTNFRFTAKEPGYYLVIAQTIYGTVTLDKVYDALIYKDGAVTTRSRKQSLTTAGVMTKVSDILYLAVNGYLELWTYHNAGVNRDMEKGSIYTYMAIRKLSTY